MSFEKKLAVLDRRIQELSKVAVAFSAGVDSSALLHACRRVLGKRNVLAVTADSPSFPRHEKEEAIALAKQIDVDLEFVFTQELNNPDYSANTEQRCYFCKKELFTVMEPFAKSRGFTRLVYGAILDDLYDFRPGSRAAVEFEVAAPLQETGLSKEEVRLYSSRYGLPTASKSSFACLSSRIPHGTPVLEKTLEQVERAESVLRALGFRQYRVRHHGTHARVELDRDEIPRALGKDYAALLAGIQAQGFQSVEIDTQGYRSRSLPSLL